MKKKMGWIGVASYLAAICCYLSLFVRAGHTERYIHSNAMSIIHEDAALLLNLSTMEIASEPIKVVEEAAKAVEEVVPMDADKPAEETAVETPKAEDAMAVEAPKLPVEEPNAAEAAAVEEPKPRVDAPEEAKPVPVEEPKPPVEEPKDAEVAVEEPKPPVEEPKDAEVAVEEPKPRVDAPEEAKPVPAEEPKPDAPGPAPKSASYADRYSASCDTIRELFHVEVKTNILAKKKHPIPNPIDCDFCPVELAFSCVAQSHLADESRKALHDFCFPAQIRAGGWPNGVVCYNHFTTPHSLLDLINGTSGSVKIPFNFFELVCKDEFNKAIPLESLSPTTCRPFSSIIEAIGRIDDRHKGTLRFPAMSRKNLTVISQVKIMTGKKLFVTKISPMLRPDPPVIEMLVSKQTTQQFLHDVAGASKGAELVRPGRATMQQSPSIAQFVVSNIIFLARDEIKKYKGSSELKAECKVAIVDYIKKLASLVEVQPQQSYKQLHLLVGRILTDLESSQLTPAKLTTAIDELQESARKVADPVLSMTRYDRFVQFLEQHMLILDAHYVMEHLESFKDIIEYLLGHEAICGPTGVVDFLKCFAIVKNATALDILLDYTHSCDSGVGPGLEYIANLIIEGFPNWLSVAVFSMLYEHDFDKDLVKEYKRQYVDAFTTARDPVKCIFGPKDPMNSPTNWTAYLDHPEIYDLDTVETFVERYTAKTANKLSKIDLLAKLHSRSMEIRGISGGCMRVTRGSSKKLELADRQVAKETLKTPTAFEEPQPVVQMASGKKRRRIVETGEDDHVAAHSTEDVVVRQTRSTRSGKTIVESDEERDGNDPDYTEGV